MNVNSAAEKKSPFYLRLTSFFSGKGSDSILFWAFLPICLLLLNVGIGFLNPCFFTKYIPFLALVSLILTFRFKALGLSSSYIAFFLFLLLFFFELSYEERIWHMGLLFILAVNIFILLLCIEEAEDCLERISKDTQLIKTFSNDLKIEFQLAKKTAEEKEKELQEEIEKLKQEAELRRIEKVNDLKRMDWVQAEIELLTTQKEEFIEDSRKARLAAMYQLQQFQEKEAILKTELIKCQEISMTLQQLSTNILIESPTCHNLPALSLISTDSSNTESILLNSALDKHMADYPGHPVSNFPNVMHLDEENGKKLELNPEVFSDGSLKSEDSNCQLIILEGKNKNLKKALAISEGIAKQLRSQFQEKSQILFQTRQELFQVQTQSIVLEKEMTLSKFDYASEEIKFLEKDIATLIVEIEILEKEINQLEELISHILFQ